MLDARAGFDCTVAMMKTKIFALLAGVVVIAATGCVSTVSGTKSPAIWFGRDNVSGRYERSLDQVYQAAVAAITTDGVLVTEYVPHDTTNSTRALYGRVNDRNVWIRVEQTDPKVTDVTVQSRTKFGDTDLDVAHEVEKEIALQLAR
jgi:Protein of unknown function (DUF3568)